MARIPTNILILALTVIPCLAWGHGGGIDSQGGHNDRAAGNYHFHQGPLDGQTFDSKDLATTALSSLSTTNQPDAPPVPPEIDLTPFLPAHEPDAQIVVHQAYTLQYSEAHEQAAWVMYRITAEQLRTSIERTDNFRTDPLVSTGSAILDDYSGSGYDRGHLAPAATMAWSGEIMSESFFLSNMSPQDPGFNRGIWRVLEAEVRDFAMMHGSVLVITGPVLRPGLPTIGPSGVSVPEHYYKVVLDIQEPGVGGIAFLLANAPDNKPLSACAVPIDAIEVRTQIDFFPALEDGLEERLESEVHLEHWGLSGSLPTATEYRSWGSVKGE